MLGFRMSPEKETSSELVTVFQTSDEAEALVVHGLLESAGIESILPAEQEVLPGVGGAVIRLLPEHAEEARRIIEEYRASPASDVEANGEPGVEP